MEPSKYSLVEQLRDGRPFEIRALRPTDEEDMLAAVDRTSAQSLYRRFFCAKRHFSDKEKAFFLNVDFVEMTTLTLIAVAVLSTDVAARSQYRTTRPSAASLAHL